MSLKRIPIAAGQLEEAMAKLGKDRWLRSSVAKNPTLVERCRPNPFNSLITAICGQQISVRAAAAIKLRLLDAVGATTFKPESMEKLSKARLLSCGLSNAKAATVNACAKHCMDMPLTPASSRRLSDEQIVDRLVQIKGVGPWTAHMVLIFGLGRADVMPVTDAGIVAGARRLFGLGKSEEAVAKLEQVAPSWQPYRSVAAVYLWAFVD